MARSQVTHFIEDFYGISIALAIRSIDRLRKQNVVGVGCVNVNGIDYNM